MTAPRLPLHHPRSGFMSERAGLQQGSGELSCTGGGEVLPRLPHQSSQVFPGCTAQAPHCQATTAAWHPSALLVEGPWEPTQKGLTGGSFSTSEAAARPQRLHLNPSH